MKNFWSIFISVSIWAVIIALCFVFLRNCNRPQFFTVSMAEDSLAKEIAERKGIVDWSQLQVDSTGVVSLAASIDSVSLVALKNKILREEVQAGRLLTANQMSEKITGYYDKLIDVLIALFVVFTVVSYFAIRNLSKRKSGMKPEKFWKIPASLKEMCWRICAVNLMGPTFRMMNMMRY